jgi:hypothetical protein
MGGDQAADLERRRRVRGEEGEERQVRLRLRAFNGLWFMGVPLSLQQEARKRFRGYDPLPYPSPSEGEGNGGRISWLFIVATSSL